MAFIYINKHPAGKIWNFAFGIASIIDGIVRVVSLGFVASSFALITSRYQAKAIIQRSKKHNS